MLKKMKPPTRVQNHWSVTLTENILIPESEASPLDRVEACASRRGRVLGGTRGDVLPQGREGREWVPRGGGRGAPLRPGPQPSRLCAPSLSASCAKTATETNANLTDSSQAGDAHDRLVSVCAYD